MARSPNTCRRSSNLDMYAAIAPLDWFQQRFWAYSIETQILRCSILQKQGQGWPLNASFWNGTLCERSIKDKKCDLTHPSDDLEDAVMLAAAHRIHQPVCCFSFQRSMSHQAQQVSHRQTRNEYVDCWKVVERNIMTVRHSLCLC